ncbi:MAG: hypothetical protein AVO34_12745 [Firmicutes bacterium ML8_F2]|nr:MAG: hypothetical protein AVO34_12745 [Firmicutes bacterium ML8_F2]
MLLRVGCRAESAGCGRPAVFSGAAARARRPVHPLSASAGGRGFVAFRAKGYGLVEVEGGRHALCAA